MLTTNVTPHALLAALDTLLKQLAQHPAVEQADKATCVLLGVQAADLRRKYLPKPAPVSRGQQYAMLAGAPEAEQDALLGRAS